MAKTQAMIGRRGAGVPLETPPLWSRYDGCGSPAVLRRAKSSAVGTSPYSLWVPSGTEQTLNSPPSPVCVHQSICPEVPQGLLSH